MGQLPASALCFYMLLHMIIVKQIICWLSVFVYPWGSGSIWLYPCLICGENPQGTFTPVQFSEYVLCLRQFCIFIFWSYEPCRYFTAGKIMESEFSLFCMNASLSVRISLWRSVPVWLCLWIMTVYIRQDYSLYVMLWCNKNKDHGFFVFLLTHLSFTDYYSLCSE